MDNIQFVITNIVLLLLYYIPGYLFFATYRICYRKNTNEKINQLNAVVFSVIVVSIFDVLFSDASESVKVVSTIVYSVII